MGGCTAFRLIQVRGHVALAKCATGNPCAASLWTRRAHRGIVPGDMPRWGLT
jgi:hypothetical protein